VLQSTFFFNSFIQLKYDIGSFGFVFVETSLVGNALDIMRESRINAGCSLHDAKYVATQVATHKQANVTLKT
jgi:hypothetical protein